MHERHACMLARYAELALSLAEQLHHDAMTAETPGERAEIASAFHRICRSGRQSMALEAKLLRDAQREARAEADLAQAAQDKRIAARRQTLGRAVERLIWTEVEDDDQAERLEDLDARLAEEAMSDAFLDQPAEAQIARLCRSLDLEVPSPLAAEGGGRSPTDEGSRSGLRTVGGAPAAEAEGLQPGAAPQPTASGGHLLPQAEGASWEPLDFDAAPTTNSS